MLLIETTIRYFDGKSASQDAGVDQDELGREDDGHTALVSRAFTVVPAGAGTDGGTGEGTAPVGDVKFRPMGFLQKQIPCAVRCLWMFALELRFVDV